MGTCSICNTYRPGPGPTSGDIVTLNPGASGETCTVPTPVALPVNIARFTSPTTQSVVYNITIGTPGNSFTYTLTITGLGSLSPMATRTASPDGVSITFPRGPNGSTDEICGGSILTIPNGSVTQVLLAKGAPLNPASYVEGDTYIIYTNVCCFESTNGAYATFDRPLEGSVSTNLTNITPGATTCIGCQCIEPDAAGNFQVPQIQITAQTNVEGSDVGDAVFIICDEFDYNKHRKIPHNTCNTRYIRPNQVKQTKFNKCCPYMVSVLRGRGKTLYDRVLSIYNKLGEARIGVSFAVFYQNIVLYGMAKYILSKLLYGDFNIDYLLGKYNEQFLCDLKNSRFCAFTEFFESRTSPVRGYNKYFKYE